MRTPSIVHTLLLGAFLLIAPSLSAVILAYEGFDTDATGSGIQYEDAALLPGQGATQPRTGFTGDWFALNENVSGSINVRATTEGLSYPGFVPGQPGAANPFRSGGAPGGAAANSDKWVGRSLNVTNAGGQLDNGYYVAALVDFNDAAGGGFGWTIGGGSQFLEYDFDNGNNATFTSSGNSGESATVAPLSSGTNLFVIQFTADTSGTVTSGASNPNTSFYTKWNLWVNPDLAEGTLGTVTASGWGIGLIRSDTVQDFNSIFVSASNLDDAEMFVDELYISTSPADFIIPEPSSMFLIILTAGVAAVMWRRKRG